MVSSLRRERLHGLDATSMFSLAMIVLFLGLFVMIFPPDYRPELKPRPGVDLPWSGSAEQVQDSASDLWITIQADGTVYVGVNTVRDEQQLQEALLMIRKQQSRERHIILRADAAAPFPLVRDVLRAMSNAGYSDVTILTFQGQRIDAMRKRSAG